MRKVKYTITTHYIVVITTPLIEDLIGTTPFQRPVDDEYYNEGTSDPMSPPNETSLADEYLEEEVEEQVIS